MHILFLCYSITFQSTLLQHAGGQLLVRVPQTGQKSTIVPVSAKGSNIHVVVSISKTCWKLALCVSGWIRVCMSRYMPCVCVPLLYIYVCMYIVALHYGSQSTIMCSILEWTMYALLPPIATRIRCGRGRCRRAQLFGLWWPLWCCTLSVWPGRCLLLPVCCKPLQQDERAPASLPVCGHKARSSCPASGTVFPPQSYLQERRVSLSLLSSLFSLSLSLFLLSFSVYLFSFHFPFFAAICVSTHHAIISSSIH